MSTSLVGFVSSQHGSQCNMIWWILWWKNAQSIRSSLLIKIAVSHQMTITKQTKQTLYWESTRWRVGCDRCSAMRCLLRRWTRNGACLACLRTKQTSRNNAACMPRHLETMTFRTWCSVAEDHAACGGIKWPWRQKRLNGSELFWDIDVCHVVPEQLERLASRRSAQAGCLGWSVARCCKG